MLSAAVSSIPELHFHYWHINSKTKKKTDTFPQQSQKMTENSVLPIVVTAELLISEFPLPLVVCVLI